jgi:hypothetical protein
MKYYRIFQDLIIEMILKRILRGTDVFHLRKYSVGMAVPWLRRLVAGLSPRRPRFEPGPVHVGFVVNNMALGQVFPPSTSIFPSHFHSTGAPLQGKMKKINNLHHRVAQ